MVFYNSLGQTRQSLVCIHVTDPFVEVRNEGGVIITSQINPFWDASNNVALDKYKVSFLSILYVPYIPVYNAMFFLSYSCRKKAPRIIHRCRI